MASERVLEKAVLFLPEDYLKQMVTICYYKLPLSEPSL